MTNFLLCSQIISPMYIHKINFGFYFPELEMLDAAEFSNTAKETEREKNNKKYRSYARSILPL